MAAVAENILHGLEWGAQEVREALIWLSDGPKRVFNDVNAMSDALKLTQKVSEIAKAVFSFSPIEQAAKALGNVTEFVSARGIIGKIADLVSFKGAWDAPMDGKPNFLWIANKVTGLVGDVSSTVKWLASVNVFGEALSAQIRGATLHIGSQTFSVLKGAGDVSCITSSLVDMADIARQAITNLRYGRYVRNGSLMVKTVGCHALGFVGDIVKVAGCVLSNIPGVNLVWGAIAGSVGSLLSLGKFYVQQYLKDPVPLGNNGAEAVAVAAPEHDGGAELPNVDQGPAYVAPVAAQHHVEAERAAVMADHVVVGDAIDARVAPEAPEIAVVDEGFERSDSTATEDTQVDLEEMADRDADESKMVAEASQSHYGDVRSFSV